MLENCYCLKIIGYNNYIKIHKNIGVVKMIGKNCSMDVLDNRGVVEVISSDDVNVELYDSTAATNNGQTKKKTKRKDKSEKLSSGSLLHKLLRFTKLISWKLQNLSIRD